MFDENILTIPNSQIINSSLVNYNLPEDSTAIYPRFIEPESIIKRILPGDR